MSTPGRNLKGTRTPQQGLPDLSTPGGNGTRTVSSTGVAVDSTGTTTIGSVNADRVDVFEVVVDPTAADFDFNVNADGDAIFASAQSPGAAAEERFEADDEQRIVYIATPTDIVFEVTSASGTGGATADVEVNAVAEFE